MPLLCGKMDYSSLEEMLGAWEKSTRKCSGNLTTDDYLPPEIRRKLLAENLSLINDLEFKGMSFPPLCQELSGIGGMNILSGLQKLGKDGNLTVFRAIRFPTLLRIWKTVYELGLSIPNYEQERILQMYGDNEYMKKRNEMKRYPRLGTQPQERIVSGVPVFCLANDALQIHHAYRSERDRVLIIAIHVPYELLNSDNVSLTANTTIDLEFNDTERDVRITKFQEKEGLYIVDYKALRVRGIDLHEMYFKGLPFDLEGHKLVGIEQRFFLLDIYQVDIKDSRIMDLGTDILEEHEYFLHGFFGDQNVFGRGVSRHLPFQCHEVRAKK